MRDRGRGDIARDSVDESIGRSSALAVRNAVAMAHRFAADRFIDRVERDIATATVSHQ